MTLKFDQHKLMRWLVFLLGIELIAISINFFYAPVHIEAGDSTGLAIAFDVFWGINRSLTLLVVNVLMLVLAAIFLGWKTTKNVTLGSLLLPLFMQITPSFKVVNSTLLSVTYGGVLMGLGISLLYRVDSSSGGTTILPMILKKYFYWNPAITLMIIDLIITALNLFIQGTDGFFLASYSLVLTTITMNYTESGLDKKYQLQIMSNDKLPEILAVLQKDYVGLTIYDVTGGYSEDKKRQILMVVNPNEYGALVRKIHEIDEDAFIITSNVSKVHGGRW